MLQNMIHYKTFVIFLAKVSEIAKLFTMTMQIYCPTNLNLLLLGNLRYEVPYLRALHAFVANDRIPTAIYIVA